MSKSHPLADDVLLLTNRYIEARFGGQLLDDDAAKDFERRVKEIRAYKPLPTPDAATSSASSQASA